MRVVLYRQRRTHVNGVGRGHASAPSCRPAAGGVVVSTWMVLSHRCTRGRAYGPTSPPRAARPALWMVSAYRLVGGGLRQGLASRCHTEDNRPERLECLTSLAGQDRWAHVRMIP